MSPSHAGIVALILCACFSAPGAFAAAEDTKPVSKRFFARGALGVGYVRLEQDSKHNRLVIADPGPFWDLAVGATVWKGLAVHATYFGGLAFRPKVTQGGTPAESSRSTSLSVLGLGPGVTYHFQPLNVYVSYSAGAGWSVLRFYEHKVDVPAGASNPGFANELMIGKEWWVMRDLAIGAAAQGIYARVFDRGGDSANLKFNGFGAALLLSATYH